MNGPEQHWNPATLRRSLEGALAAAEEARLRRHLEEDCPTCLAFLASPEADRLLDPARTAELDQLLYGPTAWSDADRRTMQRQLVARIDADRPGWTAWWFRPARLVPVLAGLLLLVGWWVAWPPTGEEGEATAPGHPELSSGLKGPPTAATPLRLELTFLVLGPRHPQEERGQRQGRYHPDDLLVFRMTTSAPAHLQLVRLGGDEVQWLTPEATAPTPAGSHYLEQQGLAQAVSLRELAGPQRFLLLGSRQPLPPRAELAAALRRAVRPPAPGATTAPVSGWPPEVAADSLELTVEAEHGG